jgi:restriction system protein
VSWQVKKHPRAIYLATSTFTEDAVMFCTDKITLLDKYDLIKNIKRLSKEKQATLYQIATKGDYTTPTCPKCDKKMIKRTGKNSGSEFLGCANYPKCTNTLQVRKVA